MVRYKRYSIEEAIINAGDITIGDIRIEDGAGSGREAYVGVIGTTNVVEIHDVPPATMVTATATNAGGVGAATQFASNALIRGGTLKAPIGNTGVIYTGPSTTHAGTPVGLPLQPGESVPVAINNTDEIYIDGIDGDTLVFLGG